MSLKQDAITVIIARLTAELESARTQATAQFNSNQAKYEELVTKLNSELEAAAQALAKEKLDNIKNALQVLGINTRIQIAPGSYNREFSYQAVKDGKLPFYAMLVSGSSTETTPAYSKKLRGRPFEDHYGFPSKRFLDSNEPISPDLMDYFGMIFHMGPGAISLESLQMLSHQKSESAATVSLKMELVLSPQLQDLEAARSALYKHATALKDYITDITEKLRSITRDERTMKALIAEANLRTTDEGKELLEKALNFTTLKSLT